MGNFHSYCCNDGPEEVSDDREEQSRIWSEGGGNHQYGSCLPPKAPIVYKIVLPKLLPIEIEYTPDLHSSAQNDDSANHSGSSGSNVIDAQRSNSPAISSSIPDKQIDVENSESDTMLVSIDTDSPTTPHAPDVLTASNKKKKFKINKKYDPRRPAVIKEEYCPDQFEHLRSLILKNPLGQRQFKELLWSCIPWSAPGGKSGSTFLKTVNDQFILKEMSKLELQSFLSISDEYFNYIETSYKENKPSLLSTIFGIYKIVYTHSPTQSGTEYYFMVMRNLFYRRNITQRFDLKGSVRNRLTETDDPDNTEHVLMDENLLRISDNHPLFIHARSKQIINECVENDSKFLESISVMDYSLLVGVDKENRELVLGIIDYVRPFTWDKKIERVVKSVVSSELPTIVEPSLYRERFCEAMDKYFECVPDGQD